MTGRFFALAVITADDYPGRFLAATPAYLDAYRVENHTPESIVGLSLGDVWPGIVEEGHPYRESWWERFHAAQRGPVGDSDPGEGGETTWIAMPITWDETTPAIAIFVIPDRWGLDALIRGTANALGWPVEVSHVR